MFLRLAMVLGFLSLVMLLLYARSPQVVYACTGGPGAFEEWAVHADAIVIAKAVDVGGTENRAPTATPSPVPSVTPEPAPSGDARAVSLAGIGAELDVVLSVAGSAPASIDVDSAQRQRIEEDLRRLEANPNLILPCPLDFLVERYDEGQTYFLVLGFEAGQGWYTSVQWEIDGSDVVTGGADYVDGRLALAVPRPILDAYFPGLPANTGGAPEGVEASWLIQQQRVPIEMLVAAVQGVRTGASSPAEPEQGSTENSGSGIFTPPDTGDGGLR